MSTPTNRPPRPPCSPARSPKVLGRGRGRSQSFCRASRTPVLATGGISRLHLPSSPLSLILFPFPFLTSSPLPSSSSSPSSFFSPPPPLSVSLSLLLSFQVNSYFDLTEQLLSSHLSWLQFFQREVEETVLKLFCREKNSGVEIKYCNDIKQ